MKKITTILLTTIFILTMTACKSDDDNGSNNSSNNALVGTTWEGQEVEDGIYTFVSNTQYTFVDIGEAPVDGTYTFGGSNGILNEETGFTAPFSVSGSIMSVDVFNSIRVYIKQ